VKCMIIYALTAIMLVCCTGPVLAAQVMDLQQCLETGIKANPSLKAARLDVKAAGHDIKAARSDFLPSLSTSYSAGALISESAKGPTETDYLDQTNRTFNVRLSQVLYSGSRVFNAYARAKIREQMVAAEMNFDRLELVYRIETTFYKLMKAKQDVTQVNESIARLTESVKVAEAFFEKELVPYVNVLQAKVDLADAQESLGIAKNNVNRERAALFSYMNMPDEPATEFSGTVKPVLDDPPSFDNSLSKALNNRPDIKSLEYQLKIAQKDAAIALGKYLPKVNLQLDYYDHDRDYDELAESNGYTYDRDQRNRYWSTGVYASWELFDGGKAWHERQRYKVQSERVKALITDTKNTIATGIKRALFSMAEAKQRISGARQALTAAQEYYAGEEKRLKAGVSAIPDLLDAQGRLVRAQTNETQALMDYHMAEAELKMMTGEEK